MKIDEKLLEAAKDYKYLLERGYNKKSALKFVGERYLLNETERHVLYRTVFPANEARKRREKIAKEDEVENNILVIDCYNVLITVETMLKNGIILEADNGYIRDISAIFRKYKITNLTEKALNLIIQAIKNLKPAQTIFIVDQPISKSGELAAKIRNLLQKHNIKGTAKTTKHPDKELTQTPGIIATSDTIIINKAQKTFDLPAYILKNYFKNKAKFIKLKHINLKQEHQQKPQQQKQQNGPVA